MSSKAVFACPKLFWLVHTFHFESKASILVCSSPDPICSFLIKYWFSQQPLWSTVQLKEAKYSGKNNFNIWQLSNRKNNHRTQTAISICKIDCPLYWNIIKISWLIFIRLKLTQVQAVDIPLLHRYCPSGSHRLFPRLHSNKPPLYLQTHSSHPGVSLTLVKKK